MDSIENETAFSGPKQKFSKEILISSGEYKDIQLNLNPIQFQANKRKDFTMICFNFFRLKNRLVREFLSEILCTFLLISFGCGSIAQYILGTKNNFNSFLSLNLSWSTAVTMGALIGGKISGAHMNPAVSLAMLIIGNLSPFQFLIYCIGQSVGAIFGSIMVYIVYADALYAFDGGVRQTTGPNATAGIWATYPGTHLTTAGAFLDQAFGTALLILVILALSDKRNAHVSHGLQALLVGNAVLMIGLSFGMNCGYGINPIRDFIPRLFTFICGWGPEVFTAGNYFFWIPLVAPFFGATIATFVYNVFIGNHWPDETFEAKPRKSIQLDIN